MRLKLLIVLPVIPLLFFDVFARGQYTFVDLSGVVNQNGITSLGDLYNDLPINTTLFSLTENTPYRISENSGNILVVANSPVNIPVGAFVGTFHFIGQIHFGVPTNSSNIGSYTINFSDETSLSIILNNDSGSPGWNIDDHCCNWRAQNIPGASLAYLEPSSNSKPSLLRELVFNNPNPDVMVTSIDFAGANPSIVPVLAAVTLEAIPEPSTLAMTGGGVLVLIALGLRRRRTR